ncbi:MAG TPA: dihydropteroate synthase [Chthoniobacterales bacterium]|nr:dihydropteroate synthase [Chthoniobacterales bacterium]
MGERLWKIGENVVDLSKRGMIMGVLNVTPDSFSDAGEFFATDAAIESGIKMALEGADIIDVGGESTRPGAEPVSVQEELRRVIPVIEGLRAKIDPSSPNASPARTYGAAGISISIDTSKSEVANAALDAGASIINDVTAGRGDERMLSLAAKRKATIVLMHMQGEPRTMQKDPHYEDVVTEVADCFRQQYARALECGVDPMAIAFDPGIGFGKTLEHNLTLLKNFERLRVHDRPLAVGVSRKSFLGKLVNSSEMSERAAPTIALTAILRARGADILRVHDVKENVAAMRAAEAVLT